MPLLLSIETSAPICSVALHQEGSLVGEHTLYKDKSHATSLAILIQDLIKNCGFKNSDLDAIALSEGPGSYTGLRIGTSTAKGLCYGLDIPLIAVNSLTALAAQVNKFALEKSLLIPMFDARRMEVYAQVLTTDLQVISHTTPVIIDNNAYSHYLEESRVYLFGDGAEKCKKLIIHPNAIFIDNIHPSASTIGALAFIKFLKKDFVDVAYFQPFYLKEYKAGTPKALI